MLCALSGEKAKEPVVSLKSGAIFERKLIESYIATSGTDPINDEPLTTEDLVAISSQVPTIVPPKPPAFNSIPTMLAAFQNEWDALALETFTLRKQLHKARQELSTTLYQYDAAVRVAARAIEQRDAAQKALQQISESFAKDDGKVEPPREIPVEALTDARDKLYALHKNQKLSLPVSKTATASIVTTSKNSLPEVTTSTFQNGKLVLVSGGKVEVFPEEAVYEVEDVVSAAFLNGEPVGAKKNSVVFLAQGSEVAIEPGIKQVIAHPSEPYFVVLTTNNTWALCDKTGIIFQSEPLPTITTGEIHVDGIFLAVGTTTGEVRVFDLTTTQLVSTITAKHSLVDKLQFALNGYWLVVASSEQNAGAVQVFHLRKNVVIHELVFDAKADFALDPSCLVLTTYSSKKLQSHLYVKKGKLWVDNVGEFATEQELIALHMASDAESILEEQKVRLVGVTSTEVVHYEIAFS